METLEKADKVRVRPKYRTAVHHSGEVGRIIGINLFTRFPVAVQFKTHTAIFKPFELEKV